MFSFDNINYALRPNKVIQRHMAFDGLQMLGAELEFSKFKYIGFGSIWFADFILAHKRLGVNDMLSIEMNEVTFKRAKFNAPFRSIKVVHGHSGLVLDRLTRSRSAKRTPWIVWLDYTCGPTTDVRDDIDRVVDHSPGGSVLILTVNVVGRTVGVGPDGRRENLRSIFGDAVAEDAPLAVFQEQNLPATVADCLLTYIGSRCRRLVQRPCLPAFNMPYRDNAQMLSVGVVLPSSDNEAVIGDIVGRPDWPCFPSVPIETPPLTPKELVALQRLLPEKGAITDADVRKLGFALEPGMLDVYRAHYRRYPSFFQVVA